MADGHQAFARGDLASAVTHWQQAIHEYAARQELQARSVALTHLARAYEALGYTDQAAASLQRALPLAEAAGDQAQSALILGHQGELALAAGQVSEAEQLVHAALGRAQGLEDAGLTATLAQIRGHVWMAQQHWPNALAAYRDSARVAQQAVYAGIAARALTHAALAAERGAQVQAATALLEEALGAVRRAASSHDTVAELLVIGRAYHRLARTNADLVLHAVAVFQDAAAQAQTLQDPRALSYAWGYLGRLYEEEGRYQEALDLTRRAVLAAQQIDAPESLYLWQWQTGRLLRVLGDLPAAIDAYERAVAILQTIRPALLRGTGRDVLISQSVEEVVLEPGGRGIRRVRQPERPATVFRETFGALYFGLADLYLRQATALELPDRVAVAPRYTQALHQARGAIEHFKTAELRTYFGDECVAAAPSNVTALELVAPATAVVYPILLPERTEVLVSLPAGLKRVVVPVPGPQIEQRADLLRQALQARDPEGTLRHAQTFYQWFIQPIEADLEADAI
jgi:tetratricopeptide (TPR) repeat protein